MKVGDTVIPKTPAGLWLADMPVNGLYNQKRNNVCVFNGIGKILKIEYVIIDYNAWSSIYKGIGKVKYQNCLVKCDSGTGWAGSGALIKK